MADEREQAPQSKPNPHTSKSIQEALAAREGRKTAEQEAAAYKDERSDAISALRNLARQVGAPDFSDNLSLGTIISNIGAHIAVRDCDPEEDDDHEG